MSLASSILAAFAHATFPTTEFRKAAEFAVSELDTDLDASNYDPSESVKIAMEALDEEVAEHEKKDMSESIEADDDGDDLEDEDDEDSPSK